MMWGGTIMYIYSYPWREVQEWIEWIIWGSWIFFYQALFKHLASKWMALDFSQFLVSVISLSLVSNNVEWGYNYVYSCPWRNCPSLPVLYSSHHLFDFCTESECRHWQTGCGGYAWLTRLSLAELPQASFLSRQTCVCQDKTHLLLRKKYAYVCHDKHNSVATKVLLWQTYFCCDKRHVLLWYTCLSWQHFCRNKNNICGSSHQWYQTSPTELDGVHMLKQKPAHFKLCRKTVAHGKSHHSTGCSLGLNGEINTTNLNNRETVMVGYNFTKQRLIIYVTGIHYD